MAVVDVDAGGGSNCLVVVVPVSGVVAVDAAAGGGRDRRRARASKRKVQWDLGMIQTSKGKVHPKVKSIEIEEDY